MKSPSLSRRLPNQPAAFAQSGGRSLVDWLGQGPGSAQVLALARQLLALEQAVQPVLPPALRGACRAVRLDRRQLTLAVSGAAQASRLRQMTPRLLERLKNEGWLVDEIAVKIQARTFESPGWPPSGKQGKEAIPLDARALQAFDTLRGQLPAGVLADAVQRLLVRHGVPQR